MADTDATPDPDYALVERLFTLHPPKDAEVADIMDTIRQQFIDVANTVVDYVPRTADRTVALRSIHRACVDSIAAVACNQDQL